MARQKKPEDPPAGSPAWMATFSDLMNLLLCFFVLLFSMSSVDAEKYQQIVNSFQNTFSIFTNGGSSVGDGVMVSNGVSQLNELSTFFNSMGKVQEGQTDNKQAEDATNTASENKTNDSPNNQSGQAEEKDAEEAKATLEEAQLEASERLYEKIEEALEEENLSREIDIDFTTQYVSLTMNGALLFDSGSATIKEESIPILDKVGRILERYAESTIDIEGHTDNVPINSGRFASNNALSDARSVSVFEYLLQTANLNPAEMKHSGRGEYVPIADNSTPEGRAKNRRVEIRIYNELADAS